LSEPPSRPTAQRAHWCRLAPAQGAVTSRTSMQSDKRRGRQGVSPTVPFASLAWVRLGQRSLSLRKLRGTYRHACALDANPDFAANRTGGSRNCHDILRDQDLDEPIHRRLERAAIVDAETPATARPDRAIRVKVRVVLA